MRKIKMVTIVDNIKIVTNDRRIESALQTRTRRGGIFIEGFIDETGDVLTAYPIKL